LSVRPKVLFVGAFPSADRRVYGGIVTSCAALLKSDLPLRVELDLFDTTQISNPPPPFLVRLLRAGPRFVRFLSRVDRGRPDAVLMFVATGAGLVEKGAMAWYARLRGVPVLMFPRGGAVMEACERSAFTRGWVRVAFRGAHTFLCQGEAWRSFAQKTLGFDRAHTPVVPNWTATEELLAVGRMRATRADGSLRLLFVGWLERHKGVLELLQAVAVLASQFDLTLDIVGDGTLGPEVDRFSAEHGLQGIVRRRGWLEGSALVQAFAGADVLVLPSYAEGLPNAMIEGMASGAAVVVSRVGVVPDVITHGREGLLVEPRDVKGLVLALRHLAENPMDLARMARAGRTLAEARFALGPAAAAIEAAIAAAISPQRAQ
jgi:glycosyltransferase involved in cell wall biosynthesis